jgi:hypothetical protein
MCRLSIKKDDLIKKIKLRAPERFCRAKELELPPLATDIYTKMSRIECIPLFLSEANMTGMSDLIQSSALDWIGEQFESSSEQSKETAMRALKGLQNLFKYSITEQVFSEKRVTHDPVLLLDYYRVAFAALSPRFGEANSKMLETYLKSLAAFHGEWTKDWEKGCPFAVADAFLEFLDGTLSYLSSYYCRPYYSPNEWAFAARLPWVDEPSRQSDIDKR